MKEKIYCQHCGQLLGTDFLEGKQRQVCTVCKTICYENPLPVASVVLANQKREILLVRRAKEPFRGMWCCPIGFAETGESIEDAALRELREEAGVEGKISQLIDVGSHINPLYGELLIVTFEVEKTGGKESAGDDASDARYFPVMNLPKLAFDSQVRAIGKFVELKKELWSIHDSFETFVESTVKNRIGYPVVLLSDELARAVEENSAKIVELWLDDITTNPSTRSYRSVDRAELRERAMVIMGQFHAWLRKEKSESEFTLFYRSLGKERKEGNVPLEEAISSLSLLKKHVWMFTYSFGVWEKAVDIYRMFELGERLVYFFDRAAYHTAVGYRKDQWQGKEAERS
ncbi:MAG: NUDIX hydrolase [Syntrophorhabdaceae bacterium]|nr:NUDIX domain-containing protein [Syntrophorhabdaceae bacterium]MDD4195053.1 NUDIX hydrolase [Syntrophorhabdaceae bacterium]HOC45872.1 NUDIX hydrolase [Syntrophorhabdaceae bacterium]